MTSPRSHSELFILTLPPLLPSRGAAKRRVFPEAFWSRSTLTSACLKYQQELFSFKIVYLLFLFYNNVRKSSMEIRKSRKNQKKLRTISHNSFTKRDTRLARFIHSQYFSVGLQGFPGGSVVKNLPANDGDWGSIPGWGRSLGEGNGNPLQYSCLENPMEEEPGGLQSMGSQRAGYKQATEHERMHCRCINVLFWTKLRSYIQFLPKSIESFCCIFEKNHRQVFGVTQHAVLSAAGQRLGLIHQPARCFFFRNTGARPRFS